ncbi:MAG TPA: PQQ-binding-like beta-propeller repeat protein, partial [Actinomycetes bacterium]|nr:PQQ-binding-like beta-propeller repeat protein [Actinomycetes bacterium]
LVAVPVGGGEPRWRLPAGAGRPGVEPVVAGDTVVVPLSGAGLVAASLATGTPKWVYPSAGEGAGSPLVLPGGDVLYGVGGLVRLDGQTGQPRWTVPGVTVYGPMALGPSGPGSGVAGPSGPGSGMAGPGVVVLAAVTDQGANLLAVDLATGQERWRQPFRPSLLVGPAAGNGIVVAVDATGQVVGLDAATGRSLWVTTMRSAPGGTPVVMGDRVVLSEAGREEDLTSREARISVHDLRTGRYLGSLEPPGFGLVKGTFGLSGGSIVTYTVAGRASVLILRPQ